MPIKKLQKIFIQHSENNFNQMRNKYLIILLLLIVNCPNIFGQFTDRYWTFGDSSAIDFKNLSNPVPATSILRSRGTCVSICDSIGNLLFYASDPLVSLWIVPGTINYGYVINKNHQIMQNGDRLKALLWYQAMIIIPDPGNSNRFYLFTAGVTTNLGFFTM